MGSFLPQIFGGAVSRAPSIAKSAIEERKTKKAEDKAERKTLALAASDVKDDEKKRLKLAVGAQAQIATTPRGVLGSPKTARRRLSI